MSHRERLALAARPGSDALDHVRGPLHVAFPCSRRGFLGALTGVAMLGTTLGASGRARASDLSPAADPTRAVGVPHVAFGAVVAAIADQDLAITVDPALPIDVMRMGDATVSVADRLLLKGEGEARGRYLDDARNAPKVGAAVRDHLRTRWPALGEAFTRRHKAWAHELVRNILLWTQALDRSGLRGKRVRDPDPDRGFIYLLEWAGAEVAADGIEPPAGLREAPREPAAASPDAYADYVRALVAALR
jgi:hypothetical protein